MSRKIIFTLLSTLVASVTLAATVNIVDDTQGTAVNDGAITLGEYVGFSYGINQGSGDVIGETSRLHIDSNTTGTLSFGLESTGPYNAGIFVFYLDTTAGGLASTTPISDTSDEFRAAVSGEGKVSNTSSELTFAPDFAADYAIAFGGDSAFVYRLLADGMLLLHASANVTRNNNFVWEMDFPMTTLGIAANSGGAFKYIGTHIRNASTAYRSNEFQGVADGSFSDDDIGTNSSSLAAGDYNTFQTVPEPSVTMLFCFSCVGLLSIRRRYKHHRTL